MPDSSGLDKPPSRTLLLSGWGLPDRPLLPRTIRHRSLAHLPTRSLSQSYTMESHNKSSNSDNSRNHINPRNILVHLNTITKQLYLILKTCLLSSRIHARLTNSPLPPQGATTRQAAVCYNDNMRSLSDPGPLSAIGFTYNIQSPTTIYPKYIHKIVRSPHYPPSTNVLKTRSNRTMPLTKTYGSTPHKEANLTPN